MGNTSDFCMLYPNRIRLQRKTVDASKDREVIVADDDYYALGAVIINPIGDIYQDVTNVELEPIQVLNGKIYVDLGGEHIGEMPDNSDMDNIEISGKSQTFTIPMGFQDGTKTVSISEEEKEKLVASNIRNNVEILGVTGTYGLGNYQQITITPTVLQQTIYPSGGYDGIEKVTMEAIPFDDIISYDGDEQDGYVVTIG